MHRGRRPSPGIVEALHAAARTARIAGMAGRILGVVAAFVAGIAVATIASWLQVPDEPPPAPPAPRAVPGRPLASAAARDGGGEPERRVRDLQARLDGETSARERVQDELARVTAELSALRSGHAAPPPPQAQANAAAAPRAAAAPKPPTDADAVAPVQVEAAASEQPAVDPSKSEMERALIAGGLDANKAADLKRRSDSLQLAEMYLRDQATREGWVDDPRFQEEMDSLHQQQISIRNELGDDGYDKYLFALGQTNRVRVDDVMADSPASEAGLAPGDQILRYGDTRIFAPDELVAQTQQGEPGEMVTLVISRQGELLTLQVPRGPLGLRVNATQSMPRSGA